MADNAVLDHLPPILSLVEQVFGSVSVGVVGDAGDGDTVLGEEAVLDEDKVEQSGVEGADVLNVFEERLGRFGRELDLEAILVDLEIGEVGGESKRGGRSTFIPWCF